MDSATVGHHPRTDPETEPATLALRISTLRAVITFSEFERRVTARRTLPPPDARRAIREAAGISTEELAQLIGVTRQAVNAWERGVRAPRPEHVTTYSAALRAMREEV